MAKEICEGCVIDQNGEVCSPEAVPPLSSSLSL